MTRDIAANHDSNYRPRGDTAMPTRTAMNHCEFRGVVFFFEANDVELRSLIVETIRSSGSVLPAPSENRRT
jgi:hypothetical protein